MSHTLADEFYRVDWGGLSGAKAAKLTDAEKYDRIVGWARAAREQNPGVFDKLTEWILDEAQWGDDRLAENEQILMHGVFARFKEQNARLRAYLQGLDSSGGVNPAVFAALDRFDDELSGRSHAELLRETVARLFADFSIMRDRAIRERIAGNKTGPSGTDSVKLFGYVNYLKDCDAQVQWALFMPDLVQKQQAGFRVDSFEYRQLPALRFIGREEAGLADLEARRALFHSLDAMPAHKSDFGEDLLLMHHDGLVVDTGPWHSVWGRFMRAETPVPEGWIYVDFVPEDDGRVGPPYCSQFAFATFTGDQAAMHKHEGYDVDAMYDVTRNIILGQGVNIPYPDKYWTANVFREGCDQPSTAYLFSVKR